MALQGLPTLGAVQSAYTGHSESIHTGQTNTLLRLRSAEFVFKYRDLSPVKTRRGHWSSDKLSVQSGALSIRPFELSKSFEQCLEVREHPDEDPNDGDPSDPGKDQSTKATCSVPFIEVVKSQRPSECKQSDLDQSLAFWSLHEARDKTLYR